MKKRAGLALLLAQVACVVFGIVRTHVEPLENFVESQAFFKPLLAYQAVSSTDVGWGFFSPEVTSGVHIIVKGRDGAQEIFSTDVARIGGNRETNLRISGGLYRLYAAKDEVSDLRLKRALTASISASFMNHYPKASEVSVSVLIPRLQPLGEVQEGRPTYDWENIYEVKYRLAGH